jgi:WhiB family redox-sensing transcriptional regulator
VSTATIDIASPLGDGDLADATLPCHREDPELFFAESPTDVELAKQVCGPCPLREPCLDAALERGEPWGVWGGELVLQGVVVARKRGPGRPRKDAAPDRVSA